MAGQRVGQWNAADFIRSVRWETAARTFGNSHNTLIGLIVDAWITADSERHWALEAAPALGKHQGHRHHSDAIFVCDTSPVGILEVEGLHPCHACDKLSWYITAYPEMFGLCVFYPIYPRGRAGGKELRFIADRDNEDAKAAILEKGKAIRRKTGRVLMMVFVEKEWQAEALDPDIDLRAQGAGYARGRGSRVLGYLITANDVPKEETLWSRA